MSAPGRTNGRESRLLLEMIARLRQSWEKVRDADQGVDLRGLAPPLGSTLRIVSLVSLVEEDMALRARRGRLMVLESYLDQFPELVRAPQLAQLILAEYRLRHQFGDSPPLEDYRARFPDQFAELTRLARTKAAEGSARLEEPSAGVRPTVVGPAPSFSLGEHYPLIRRLGAGTYGEVWLAEAPGGVQVAIKKLFRPLSQDEGRRELRVLEAIKNLQHTYLLSTHAFWEEDGRLCIVFELADGTLREHFNECRRQGLPGIPLDQLLAFCREAAEGLDFLHAHRIQHRDIKPENLMLLKGHLKVGDLGLARQGKGHDLSTASLCGSPLYMAPEVWREQISPHSDQYSLAVTYAEMRHGKHPFKASTLHQVMQAHMEREPDLNPLPVAEQEVLRKALAKDAAKRFGSCQEFLFALSKATVPPPNLSQAPLPSSRRAWLIGAASLSALVLGAAAAGWALWSSPTPESPPEPYLPPEFEQVGDQRGEWPGTERYYKTIRRRVTGGETFEFVLIPGYRERDKGIDLMPFYMLRGKVTVAQFRAVALGAAYQKRLRALEEGHPKEMDCDGKNRPCSGNWNRPELVADPQWPVRDLTVTEAHCFAIGLGCLLPTVEQWNQASGFYDWQRRRQAGEDPKGLEGPFERGWVPPKEMAADNKDVAVGKGRKSPLPVGSGQRDRSRLYGCSDMAGNGYEWTRTLARPVDGEPFVGPHCRTGDVEVRLRGHSFAKFSPLRFVDYGNIPCQRYFETREVYAFRVVLEIPDP